MGSRFARISQEADELRKKLEGMEQYYAESRRIQREADVAAMTNMVSAKFPDLSQIASSDAWKHYCNEIDPVSGQTHGQLFEAAVEGCNSNAVVALISRFKMASGVPNATHQQFGIRPEETTSPNPYGVQQPREPKVYRAIEIERFMSEVQSGKKSLNVPQYAALYKEYATAMNDGRVIE